MSSEDLETRVAAIEQRNKSVEQDKAWETSWTRKLSIGLLTYLSIAGFLLAIHKDKPFINALVPVFGFLLSTLLLPQIKRRWIQNR